MLVESTPDVKQFKLKCFRSNRSSKKRRRVPTMNQRRAANIRERRRMFNLNEAFDRLRTKVRKQKPRPRPPGVDFTKLYSPSEKTSVTFEIAV